jgi:ribosomal protein L11 methyltransferase
VKPRPTFWSVRFRASPEAAQTLSVVFQDSAVAVTIIAPPRNKSATVEGLYNTEPNLSGLTAQLTVVAMLDGLITPKLEVTKLPPLDWIKKVAEDFPQLSIARWTVHGAQHRHAVPDRRHALQIDATSAFGTGEHPTTRGCLIVLDRLLRAHDPRYMLDVGCGSGILAMAYAKSRPGRAVGVDLDSDSVAIAHANMRTNGLNLRVRIWLGNGYGHRQVRRYAPYDLIMANIFAKPLSHMAKDLKHHLRPGGFAILSGLLNSQANQVLAAHRLQKIKLVRRIRIGEWSVLVLKR